MLCGAKLRGKDAHCKKHGMLNGRCRNHGGLSPKGSDHWNHKHGHCTKDYRSKTAEGNARIKYLEQLLIQLGMVDVGNHT